MAEQRYLPIYLNDHLAGATVGLELARRARGSNQGTPVGDFLAELTREIEEDRAALERLMSELDVGVDRVKLIAAWVGEKFGRLKLNGQLTGYSPLSRLVELEALHLGVTGKLALWQALLEVAHTDPRLSSVELERLRERAEGQRDAIEEHRLRVARETFGAPATVRA